MPDLARFLVAGGLQRGALVGEFAVRVLREHRRIFVDQGEGAAQDRRGGAAILLEHDSFGVGEVAVEQFEGRAGCSAKAIDGLVGIADGEDVSVRAGQAGQNLDLGEVGVLKFVGQDEAGAGTRLGQNIFIAMQQGMRARDHVAEGAEILFLQPALHGGEDAGDLAAAAQNLGILEDVLGFHDARHGNFAAFQALDVSRVFFGRDQFVVAAADELQQVVQELGNVGGADVVLEMQLANAAAQVDPEIFFVEDAEILVRRASAGRGSSRER